jgi:hypothetical protein
MCFLLLAKKIFLLPEVKTILLSASSTCLMIVTFYTQNRIELGMFWHSVTLLVGLTIGFGFETDTHAYGFYLNNQE